MVRGVLPGGGPGDGVVNGKNMDAQSYTILGHHGSSFKRLAPFTILLVKTKRENCMVRHDKNWKKALAGSDCWPILPDPWFG